MTEDSREIRGLDRTVRELLSKRKFGIDYYQREYEWESKQVAELVEDLANKFLRDFDPAHERADVERYGHYFLGSIIVSRKNGQNFIIDGQQRMTTLTLLLMFLNNLQRSREDRVDVSELIYSEKYSKRTFNIDVEERTACMEALFRGEAYDDADQSESVRNITARYADMQELYPAELREATLPYFVDWLLENVHLVEITAYSDDDAYTIFETMNDRGLSLSPTDMLKGYLLANIKDEDRRLSAGEAWRKRVAELVELGKDEDADCLKSWLRSQYANSIRERKRGAAPKDFDRIGTEFHRWVRENRASLGLDRSNEFAEFMEKDLNFYARQYIRLRKSSQKRTPPLECVFYNAQFNFTLQYPILLAPLRPTDSEESIIRKLRVTAAYLDVLIARRIWNWRAIDYSTMQYAMFIVMRDIRGKDAAEVAEILTGKLASEQETFASNDRFYLHGMNGRQIHRVLARMTEYVETASGMESRFEEYVLRGGKNAYEIEHIWSDHPERHEDEFSHPVDFSEYRNRVGGLLLLPKSFNASYGDLPYEEKLEHYNSQNLLARSLHPKAYDHNPGFLGFVERSNLPFRTHSQFKKEDLDARQDLYRKLAEEIWTPERVCQEATWA